MPVQTGAEFWRSMSRSSMAMFVGAVFFTFATIGFITDMQNVGRLPLAGLVAAVVLSGVPAVGYALTGILADGWKQRALFTGIAVTQLALFLLLFRVFPMAPRPQSLDRTGQRALQQRLVWSGMGCIVSISLGYTLFVFLMNREGARYFRWKAEVDLAAEIHRQLVPPIALRAGAYEFFGSSEPSGEVGGDLIDVVSSGERWVAYIADVAGHGVAPGVVMGMVKSAARMHLEAADATAFLDRLNRVLYPLRAPQMFITFAYLALGPDGLEYGVAGHPAILHCSAAGEVRELVSENLPLGILPENRFVTAKVAAAPGDTFLMVTDGLLEVEDKAGNEFGAAHLQDILRQQTRAPLPELAQALLDAVRAHGARCDDQSLLLIRRAD